MSVDEMADILPVEDFLWGNEWFWLIRGLEILAMLFGVLFLAGLGWILWHWFKKNKKRIPPDEYALAQLSDLERMDLSRPTRVMEFYSGLSETLRHYIEDHLKINFIDKTEEEILSHPEWFKSLGVVESEWQNMAEFWARGQKVKFAAESVTQDEGRSDFKFVKNFVESTRKMPGVST